MGIQRNAFFLHILTKQPGRKENTSNDIAAIKKNRLAVKKRMHRSWDFYASSKLNAVAIPHWISQTKRIDSAFRRYINFVGHFENIQQDTKRLLHKINTKNNRINNFKTESSNGDLWEQYGAS